MFWNQDFNYWISWYTELNYQIHWSENLCHCRHNFDIQLSKQFDRLPLAPSFARSLKISAGTIELRKGYVKEVTYEFKFLISVYEINIWGGSKDTLCCLAPLNTLWIIVIGATQRCFHWVGWVLGRGRMMIPMNIAGYQGYKGFWEGPVFFRERKFLSLEGW